MVHMLYCLYHIVIFKAVACVCIYPDALCTYFCIYNYMYVCTVVAKRIRTSLLNPLKT